MKTKLLILILIFIVAIQQDQIHNIRKELKEINLHLDKNTEKFQGRTVNNEMSIQLPVIQIIFQFNFF
jgi:hypothetical protein